ncbi:hypothetical protein EON63_07705 [archaeon]|nr:MAG: hypothetical protein EON63_07705 [archaeon]
MTLLSIGAAVYVVHYTWTHTIQKKNSKRNEDTYIKYITTLIAPYIHTHTHTPPPSPHSLLHPKAAYIRHQGSCMCMRVQFTVHAPSILHALEVTPSKFRYPRLVIEREDFQLLCDESLLSLYPLGKLVYV